MVYTIEHIMSVFHITGITDLLVEINGNELPIMDGSSVIFIEKINETGLIELERDIEPVVITEPV